MSEQKEPKPNYAICSIRTNDHKEWCAVQTARRVSGLGFRDLLMIGVNQILKDKGIKQ